MPLTNYVESLLTNTISNNAVKGRQAIEWVIGKIETEVTQLKTNADELLTQTKKSLDDITTSAKKSMDELSTAAKKSFDNLTNDYSQQTNVPKF
jgi:ElaB/YqjD/DUF883 family membrane-anchored ribosome-binding protein